MTLASVRIDIDFLQTPCGSLAGLERPFRAAGRPACTRFGTGRPHKGGGLNILPNRHHHLLCFSKIMTIATLSNRQQGPRFPVFMKIEAAPVRLDGDDT